MQSDPILGIRVRDVVDNLVWVLQADREEEILLPHKVPPQNIAHLHCTQLHSDQRIAVVAAGVVCTGERLKVQCLSDVDVDGEVVREGWG